MSVEAAIADLTAAVRENTECLKASLAQVTLKPAAAKAKPAAAPAPAPAPAPAAAAAAPVATPPTARLATADTAAAVTPAQIKAAGDDLSILAELDRATAVAVLAEFGVQKMTAMPQSNIPEFHNKVKAAIAKLQGTPATPSLI